MSKVEARNIWKIYDGDVVAVKDISFRCEHREFVAVLGPSGCGKSSTLRMIAGLEDISKGELLFNDKVVNQLSPRNRNIALAFESYALYPPLTVYNNIGFPLLAGGMDKKEIDRKVRAIADDLELTEVLDRKPGKLSGGQQQRVSLARALVRDPSVLLLDEPLSHMDQRVRTVIRARIRRIHDELDTTTIYVTHDQEEAVALADKIIVMSMGVIQQSGTVDDLFNFPANRFVAGFIGEPPMNFLEGKVEGRNRMAVRNGDRYVSWPVDEEIPQGHVGNDALIGIRPENVRVSRKPEESSVKSNVKVVEYLGETRILTLTVGDAEIKAIVPIDFIVAESEDLWINGAPQELHVFEAETGQALIRVRT